MRETRSSIGIAFLALVGAGLLVALAVIWQRTAPEAPLRYGGEDAAGSGVRAGSAVSSSAPVNAQDSRREPESARVDTSTAAESPTGSAATPTPEPASMEVLPIVGISMSATQHLADLAYPTWQPLEPALLRVLEEEARYELCVTRRMGGPAIVVRTADLLAGDFSAVPELTTTTLLIEGTIPDDLARDFLLAVGAAEGNADYSTRLLESSSPIVAGTLVDVSVSRPVAEQVEFTGLHQGVQYPLVFSEQETARHVSGVRSIPVPDRVLAGSTTRLSWVESAGVEFILDDPPADRGQLWARSLTGEVERVFSLGDVSNGRSWAGADVHDSGTYEVVGAGPGWSTVWPCQVVIAANLGVQRAHLPVIARPYAELVLDLEPRVLRTASLGYLDSTGALTPLAKRPGPELGPLASFQDRSIVVMGLDEGTQLFLAISELGLEQVLSVPGPGRHAIDVDVSVRRVFHEARDVARSAFLQHPDAAWMILEQLASVGMPWEGWRNRKTFTPSMVGAFDDRSWRLPVDPNARHRIRVDGVEAAFPVPEPYPRGDEGHPPK